MSRSRKTYCRICEAACGLIAEIDDQGKVVSLKPDKDHQISKGFCCAKGTRFAETAGSTERMLQPALRRQGEWKDTNWQDALAEAGRRLRPIIAEHGPDAVGVYYGNPMLFNFLGLVSLISFNKALGTRNVFSSFSVDCNNKFAAARIMHGAELVHPIPDLEKAELAVMFGSNPAVSQGSFVHLDGGSTAFDRFHTRGGKSVWIDPRRSESVRRWADDQGQLAHLRIRPGSDVYLILALLNELSDLYRSAQTEEGLKELLDLAAVYPAERTSGLTDIPENQIKELARRIRNCPATTFHASVGLNMGPFGTLAYIGVQALAWLTGNFDSEGGVLFHPMGTRSSAMLHRLGISTNPEPSRVGNFVGSFDELPVGILADEILQEGNGQIKALLVIGGNPLRAVPGSARLAEALSSLDTLISIDMFANETSELADIFLPTTSWLERFDVAVAGAALQRASVLQYAGAVQKAPGEVRHERRILHDLAAELGIRMMGGVRRSRAFANWNLDRLFPAVLGAALTPLRLLKRSQNGMPSPVPKAGSYVGRGPMNPGRKVRFWEQKLNPEKQRLAVYAKDLESEAADSFRLISRRRRLGHNSWIHAGHRGQNKTLDSTAWISPADMAGLGIDTGDMILLKTIAGELRIGVTARDEVSPGTVVIPHGLQDYNVNTLFPSGVDYVEPPSGNHIMTGIPVQIELIPQKEFADYG